MLGNRRVDTKPEILVRRELHARGLRYRVDHTIRHSGTWTRPDVVFTRWKVAVYVDGCFWHGCPLHGTQPAANRGYWSAKIVRNRSRDRRTGAALREMGWCVLRFWEHTPPGEVADLVELVLSNRRNTVARI